MLCFALASELGNAKKIAFDGVTGVFVTLCILVAKCINIFQG